MQIESKDFLSTSLKQVVETTCNKSANIKLPSSMFFTNLMELDAANTLDATIASSSSKIKALNPGLPAWKTSHTMLESYKTYWNTVCATKMSLKLLANFGNFVFATIFLEVDKREEIDRRLSVASYFPRMNSFHNICILWFSLLRWSVTRWNKCSQDCGSGRQNRLVFCMRQFPNGTIAKTSNHMCTKDKPSSKQNCYLRSCKMKWITKQWSKVGTGNYSLCGLMWVRVFLRTHWTIWLPRNELINIQINNWKWF